MNLDAEVQTRQNYEFFPRDLVDFLDSWSILFLGKDLVAYDMVLSLDKVLPPGLVLHRHVEHLLCILLCRFYLQQLCTQSHTLRQIED